MRGNPHSAPTVVASPSAPEDDKQADAGRVKHAQGALTDTGGIVTSVHGRMRSTCDRILERVAIRHFWTPGTTAHLFEATMHWTAETVHERCT